MGNPNAKTPLCLNPTCSSITTRTGRTEYGTWEMSIGGRYRRLQEEFKCVVCGLVFVTLTGVEREDTAKSTRE